MTTACTGSGTCAGGDFGVPSGTFYLLTRVFMEEHVNPVDAARGGPRLLPKVAIRDKFYCVDARLMQLRNVNYPVDVYELRKPWWSD